MPAISLCMIVRNEEKNIRRCLDSVKNHVDEMVIVDTGSTDRTKAICREYGARIFDFKWKGDFAEARNFSLKKAQGDWVLWLDADEAADMVDFPSLRTCLNGEGSPLILIPMLHFYGKEPADENRVYLSSFPRLIRNGAGIRFTGKIHEHLVSDTSSLSLPAEVNRSMRILHYGYMESAWKHKCNRNLELLLREKSEQPNNAWLDYHLAAEYHRSGKCGEAFQSVNRSIVGFLRKNLLPPPLVYKLKYDILITNGNYAAAHAGIEKAVSLYPDYVDLRFYQGMAQFALGEYGKAEQTFSHCLVMGESNPEYLILKGTGSFFSLYCLSLCYEKQGKSKEAEEAFRQAKELNPDPDFSVLGILNLVGGKDRSTAS